MVFRADQKDARQMARPDSCKAREERQAALAPVLRMKVLFLPSQLVLLTYTLHVEKVRGNLQKIYHNFDTKIVKNDLF